MLMKVLNGYSNGEQIYILYLVFIGILGFALMGLDKLKAKKEQWRIKELTLMLVAAMGGATGILIGMVVFKHKTSKKKFYLGVPVLYIFNIIMNGIIISLL